MSGIRFCLENKDVKQYRNYSLISLFEKLS